MCHTPRTRVFISKPNNFRKFREENKFLRQKIKELEDKVDDLKSDAKSRRSSLWLKKETKQVLAPETQYGLGFD